MPRSNLPRDATRHAVALASEDEAAAARQAENPDIAVFSRQAMTDSVFSKLGMTGGDITEWVPLDCKQKITRIDGRPYE